MENFLETHDSDARVRTRKSWLPEYERDLEIAAAAKRLKTANAAARKRAKLLQANPPRARRKIDMPDFAYCDGSSYATRGPYFDLDGNKKWL